uniref:Twinfilin n=1 Tax=Callorhinchus milii TaxID=7868 RepID=K4FSA3_CALMI|nr:twinfilin-2-like isoform 1 [Callorhinchus milii]
MSHQTGINASQGLKTFFSKSKDGSVRLIQVLIEDEALVLGESRRPAKGWEEDYEFVAEVIGDTEPCYILYRLDSKNSQGFEWLFILWSPEKSTIRHKMLYAGTRATLKMEFGGGHIKDDFSGTQKDEVTLSGYKNHLVSASAPAPLTVAEQELHNLKLSEGQSDVSVDSRHQTLQGIAFPVDDEAQDALRALREKRVNYIQLELDVVKEKVLLVKAEVIELLDLPGQVPSHSPRWHLYRYPHSHEGDWLESVVFIYSMPGYSCSIRERMLYSSCKGPLVDFIQKEHNLELARKMEIDDGKELTADFLYNEIHPKQHAYKPAFGKPPRPRPDPGAT